MNLPAEDERVFATCLVCAAKVPLEARQFAQASEYATVPCTGCSALVPVRPTDALHAVQEDMRAALVGARARRRSLLGRWRRA